MANLSGINRLIKLHKLLLPINISNAHLMATFIQASQIPQRCVATLTVNPRQTVQTHEKNDVPNFLRRMSTSEHRRNYSVKNKTREYCTSSKKDFSSSTTLKLSIDEFRSREEQREAEAAANKQREEEKDNGNKTDDGAKKAKIDSIRIKILDAALCHVPTLGWSREAIVQGAEDAGFPSVVHGMFPEGAFAIVSHFNAKCNEKLLQQMQAETQNGQEQIENPLDFLVSATRSRIEMIVPYKAHWPQALALIAKPQNASTALAQVLTLVDDICYYSGDRSVDFGWYTRRVGLATILKMTELYLLQDNSPNHANTWEFLKNRMDEAVQLQMILSQTEDMTHSFQRSFNSAFITARNILGMGYNRN